MIVHITLTTLLTLCLTLNKTVVSYIDFVAVETPEYKLRFKILKKISVEYAPFWKESERGWGGKPPNIASVNNNAVDLFPATIFLYIFLFVIFINNKSIQKVHEGISGYNLYR